MLPLAVWLVQFLPEPAGPLLYTHAGSSGANLRTLRIPPATVDAAAGAATVAAAAAAAAAAAVAAGT